MLKSLGGNKYSPDHVIGTPKKAPKVSKDEVLYGTTILKKDELLTTKSCEVCGFCTAGKRFESRKYLKPKIESDLSFKIADDSLNELDKNDPIYFKRDGVIRANLEKKYLTSWTYYNVKVINDIIYNECSNIVSMFKDYLIFDDVSEFLKRFYNVNEAIERMPRIIEFYDKFSKVFPNYVNLPENKYMFKNIERKQKYWDSWQQYLMDKEEQNQAGLDQSKDKKTYMFDDWFIHSVLNMSVNQNNDSTVNHIVNLEESHC